MPLCGQQRVREMESIAAGAQEVPYSCDNEATETVALDGELHKMCARCAGEAVNQFSAVEVRNAQERDAAQLRQYSAIMGQGAAVWTARPEIAQWFTDCAQQLEGMALGVLEGKL
jgi:hypothetical protein